MNDIKLVLKTLVIILISLDCYWYEYTQFYFIQVFLFQVFKKKKKKKEMKKEKESSRANRFGYRSCVIGSCLLFSINICLLNSLPVLVCRIVTSVIGVVYTTAFVTPVRRHWLEREMAQWVHQEESIRRSTQLHPGAAAYITPSPDQTISGFKVC